MFKLAIVIFLFTSCSVFKSKTARCFDVYELYGKVNMVVIENGRTVFECREYKK